METTEKKRFVRLKESGEVVEVYFYHRDGVGYIGDHGVVIINRDQYEEIE